MPILQAERSVFPDDLLTDEVQTDRLGDGQQWWAIYTMSRQEKNLMRRLEAKGISFYCPITRAERRSPSGRVRTSYLPVFSNYVFICGNEDDRYETVSTGCVSRCLFVEDPWPLVRALQTVEQLVATGSRVRAEALLEAGTEVRVKTGPLRGVVGRITERRTENRLVVNVDFLQQGAAVDLHDWDVERL